MCLTVAMCHVSLLIWSILAYVYMFIPICVWMWVCLWGWSRPLSLTKGYKVLFWCSTLFCWCYTLYSFSIKVFYCCALHIDIFESEYFKLRHFFIYVNDFASIRHVLWFWMHFWRSYDFLLIELCVSSMYFVDFCLYSMLSGFSV